MPRGTSGHREARTTRVQLLCEVSDTSSGLRTGPDWNGANLDDALHILLQGSQTGKESSIRYVEDLLESTIASLDRLTSLPGRDNPDYNFCTPVPAQTLMRLRSQAIQIVQFCSDTRRSAIPIDQTISGLDKSSTPRHVPHARTKAHKSQTLPLRHWYLCHRDNPYPSDAQKRTLSKLSNLSIDQISTWFINARRRSRGGENFLQQEIGVEFRTFFDASTRITSSEPV